MFAQKQILSIYLIFLFESLIFVIKFLKNLEETGKIILTSQGIF